MSILLHPIAKLVSNLITILNYLTQLNISSLSMAKKTRYLNIGQCLPDTCSAKDVTVIMNNDPAFVALNEATIEENGKAVKATEAHVFDTRAVPGDFNIWKERKFYVFT